MSAVIPNHAHPIRHVHLWGVRVAASFQGRSIPEWLTKDLERRFSMHDPVVLDDVRHLVRHHFPQGSCADIDDLGACLARAMRKVQRSCSDRLRHRSDVGGSNQQPDEAFHYERPRG